jgi:hypothetical protein
MDRVDSKPGLNSTRHSIHSAGRRMERASRARYPEF